MNATSVSGKRDVGIKSIFHRERSPARLLIIEDNILQAKIMAKPTRTLCLKQFEREITNIRISASLQTASEYTGISETK